ncbi:GntR family transcriptional regulator [Paenibacillus senegalimassiliensis]|uniref:GntR family transcriptional regulator n=1 Tax=Paenibacillus senegalimassiliensis TaxID=1737426 RepID=UPI001651E65B|nr:GntR family transcriptional regulator [Paenibacillus senegalimassiliensis]
MADVAYSKIREKIITAHYMPGDLLSENELAETLSMSRTPIRSAIAHLEVEGFVTSFKNRGIFVKELSLKEIFDVLEAFLCMQEFAINTVIERDSSLNNEELEIHLNAQIKAEQENDYIAYINHAMAFNRSLVYAANNQVILKLMDSIIDKMIQFGIVNWKLTPNQIHYSGNLLNTSIYEAICSANYSKAKQMCRQKYLDSRESILNSRIYKSY